MEIFEEKSGMKRMRKIERRKQMQRREEVVKS
jgi:hypothetical protein